MGVLMDTMQKLTDHMVTVSVPPDERGKFVKEHMTALRVTQHSTDAYGNWVFQVTPRNYDYLLRLTGLYDEKSPMDGFDVSITHLMLADMVYGQVWFSTQALEDWNDKTRDAW